MKHLRILKDVPLEGLKAGDVVNFMDDTLADSHIEAGNAEHVQRNAAGEFVPVAKE